MEHRHLIAYAILLLIVAGLGAAAFIASRDWRASRRAHFRFEREQRQRRSDARADGEA
jgi:hypothetical protein